MEVRGEPQWLSYLRPPAAVDRRIYESILAMRFSWDHRKSDQNLRDRGFDLEFSTLVFEGPTLEREDDRRDYGERRIVAIGLAQGIPLTVVFTDRTEAGVVVVRRIISARLSNRRERQAYSQALSQE